MSFNKIILVGNLGKDPELRYTPRARPSAVSTWQRMKAQEPATGEMDDTPTWFRVTLWGAKQKRPLSTCHAQRDLHRRPVARRAIRRS